MALTITNQRRQFAIFVLCGGLAALVNFVSRIVINEFLAYTPSIVLAYLFGLITAFVLNRLFVFKQTANAIHQQATWFVVVNLVALLQTLAVSLLLVHIVFPWIGVHRHADTFAHAVGVVVPVFTSFLGHKYLTFRP